MRNRPCVLWQEYLQSSARGGDVEMEGQANRYWTLVGCDGDVMTLAMHRSKVLDSLCARLGGSRLAERPTFP